MFDDRPKWLETIDELATEKREELEEYYTRFLDADGRCHCSLCKVLNRMEREAIERDLFKQEQELDNPYKLRHYNSKRESKQYDFTY